MRVDFDEYLHQIQEMHRLGRSINHISRVLADMGAKNATNANVRSYMIRMGILTGGSKLADEYQKFREEWEEECRKAKIHGGLENILIMPEKVRANEVE